VADELAQVGEPAGWPRSVITVLADQVTASAPARVTVVRGGPYVVTGPVAITDHLGCPVTVEAEAADAAGRPAAVLCRCGASAVKPGCDGACVHTGFQDAKDPSRVPDRRDTHIGQQVTILDNRGEPVTYGDHIRTMFRERDRRSMLFAFDLWSHDDTRAHATAIHERLQAGTMPGDGAWPIERTEVFARWIAEGMA